MGGAFARSLQCSDRCDLDQQVLAHQAVDHEQRIWRKGPAGKQAREFTRPIGGKFRDVLRMHEIAGEGDDVGNPALCEASAAPIASNTSVHCASKSAGALPFLSVPIWPAMNKYSEAFTRAMFA